MVLAAASVAQILGLGPRAAVAVLQLVGAILGVGCCAHALRLRLALGVGPAPSRLFRGLEQSGRPLVVTDIQRRILWANDAFARLTGYALHEVRGRHPSEFLHCEQTDKAAVAGLRATLNAGEGARVTLRNRTRDGRLYWVETDIQPVRDAAGKLEGFVAVETDVTEQVALRDSILEQQERLRTVIEGAELGTWDWDIEQDELRTNARWLAMLGYAPGQRVPSGAAWLALLHPEDLAATETLLAEHLRGGSSRFHHQVRMKQQDGSWRWVLTAGCVSSRGPNGEPRRMVGIHLDIDEKLRAQEQAREQHRLFERIAANVPGMIYQYRREADGRAWFPYASAGISQIYGISPEEAAQNTYKVVAALHPEDRDGILRSIEDSATTMTLWNHEYRVCHPDGTTLWVEGRAQPRSTADGAVIWEGYITNVSGRKQAELAAAFSRAQLATFVKHVPAAAAMFDTRMRYIAFSDRWLAEHRLAGVSIEGLCHYDLIPDLPKRWRDAHQRCLLGAVERCEAERLEFPDGSTHWQRWEVHPWFGPDGHVGGLVLVTEDVTMAHQAAAELARHRDHLAALVDDRTRHLKAALGEARKANAAKSEFLANMSHELRTPMHAILSFAELGIHRATPPEQAKLQRYFRKIHEGSRRLLSLLNDLLDLSKIEAGQFTLKTAPVELNALAAQCIEALAPLASARGVRLSLNPSSPRLELVVDALRIGQVLSNLLSNAIKFSPAGGEVQIGLHPQRGPDGPVAVLEVADRGVGVPDGELERIFEKFVQSSRTSTGAGGTGLGLPICREIVLAHGGSIVAAHGSNGGTVFTVHLPMPVPTQPTAPCVLEARPSVA